MSNFRNNYYLVDFAKLHNKIGLHSNKLSSLNKPVHTERGQLRSVTTTADKQPRVKISDQF